jgi:tetratricopeptide (TPR) repeat protein
LKNFDASFAAASGIGLLALVMGLEIARLTVANRVADDDPAFAAWLAPGSPSANVSAGMAAVGRAAAQGRDPDQLTMDRFRAAAAAAPLAPEPFLLHGALAERAGDLQRARILLDQARLRNPRSTAALYLLADISVRENDVLAALSDIATLARLLPAASMQVIPSLAQFARTPGAEKELGAVLEANPKLKRPLLISLAADPANAELVLSLAGSDSASLDTDARSWKALLVRGFVARGDYDRAYRIWRNFAGLPANASPLVFNGDFRRTPAPPPFDWSYASGTGGVAEPDSGRLHVLYYGRDNNFILATQLLLLPPGVYRLRSPVTHTGAGQSLGWNIACAKSGSQLLDSPIGGGVLEFTVQEGCPAQTLTLRGRSSDTPQDVDALIGPVSIQKAAS